MIAQAADEPVALAHPPAGDTVRVVAAEGTIYDLSFDTSSATASLDGADFTLSFEDGSKIVFERLVEVAASPDPPVFRIDGVDIASEILISQVSYLTSDFGLEPAAAGALFTASPRASFGLAPFPELRRARLGQ